MSDLDLLCGFVREKTQNVINRARATQILGRLLLEYPGRSLADVLATLDAMPSVPAWMSSIITINETFFFRHPEHFELLKARLPRLRPRGGTVQALCAGSSTGQETYSVAMVMAAELPPETPFAVTGIDLDPRVVEIAKRGEYTDADVSRTPEAHRLQVLHAMDTRVTAHGALHHVKDDLQSKVRFLQGNIFKAILDRYDVVFVRNVLIYFTEANRSALVSRLWQRVNPGGLLFVGAGELLPAEFRAGAPATSVLEGKAA
jgi:chemotaxis protein methyltransferase CheR